MRMAAVRTAVGVGVMIGLCGLASHGGAQDRPTDNMQILRDKVRADKKSVVATNMELTESETKGFWPLYAQYQRELERLNRRLASLVESYAADFRSKPLTDDKAKKLIVGGHRAGGGKAQERVCGEAEEGPARGEGRPLLADREQDSRRRELRSHVRRAARQVAAS